MSKKDRWNERYAGSELVWSALPNRVLARESETLKPGKVLDVACGEGRNAIWLAEQGWEVTAIDFSDEGVAKGRKIAEKKGVKVDWIVEDVSTWKLPESEYDLVVLLYLHTDPAERGRWLTNVIGAVKKAGTFIYIGHDQSNIKDGVGGPQHPDHIPAIDEILPLLGDFEIEVAEVIERPVDNDPGHGRELDAFIRAKRR